MSDQSTYTPLFRKAIGRELASARLGKYIERKITKARQMKRETREGYDIEKEGPQYWRGYEAALINLRRKMKQTRIKP